MPSAKPRYDSGGDWKYPQYTDAEWEELTERLRKKLREFYPDSSAKEDPDFGHPADEWANYLIQAARDAISTMLWLRLRLKNEELRAEQKDLLGTLSKAEQCLDKISHDLNRLLGVDADIAGCRDKIREILPYVAAAENTIKQLPRAKKLADAQHEAAMEMVIRVGRILNRSGIKVPASGNTYFEYTPPAIQIFKILGDELGLRLSPLTWRGAVIAVKKKKPSPNIE